MESNIFFNAAMRAGKSSAVPILPPASMQSHSSSHNIYILEYFSFLCAIISPRPSVTVTRLSLCCSLWDSAFWICSAAPWVFQWFSHVTPAAAAAIKPIECGSQCEYGMSPKLNFLFGNWNVYFNYNFARQTNLSNSKWGLSLFRIELLCRVAL